MTEKHFSSLVYTLASIYPAHTIILTYQSRRKGAKLITESINTFFNRGIPLVEVLQENHIIGIKLVTGQQYFECTKDIYGSHVVHKNRITITKKTGEKVRIPIPSIC